MSDFVKHYEHDGVTVVWKPELCEHSTKCFRGLPSVFNPRVKPWVDLSASSPELIIAQVHQCPSGALSILNEDPVAVPQPEEAGTMEPMVGTLVRVSRSGPARVDGPVTLVTLDGSCEIHESGVAICRCDPSGNKVHCDCVSTSS
jgi:uncharacterized Fe-S cluster protein YjdI